ncbi:MAG: glucose-1-phosphate adenylyltransferase [Candidatus Sedimenticola sp. (ex Thyasira tokunagai)]
MEDNPRNISLLTRSTLALILAGGQGSRLKQLTTWRTKPAVPFGGKFRIIDFPLSNCLNSGIRRIAVLTQYKAHSLLLHLNNGWSFLRGQFGEYVEVLPASQRLGKSWYSGTADAVFQNLDILRSHGPKYILILAGDHIYKMDYGTMLAHHVDNNADMTVGCIEVPLEEAKSLGVMSVDKTSQVTAFVEKPANPEPMVGQPEKALASMGIYIFNTDFLYDQLIRDAGDPDSSHDFGHDIIPHIIDRYRVVGFPFKHQITGERIYWRDVGTVDAYWKANLELIGVTPELNLYDKDWPIWTYQAQQPPAKFVFDDDDRRGMAVDSMVSGGCIISGAYVSHSVLFSNVHIGTRSNVQDSAILPDVEIGENCRITKAVIDKGCVISNHTVIGENPEEDARNYHVTEEGVVLVSPGMLGQDLNYAL